MARIGRNRKDDEINEPEGAEVNPDVEGADVVEVAQDDDDSDDFDSLMAGFATPVKEEDEMTDETGSNPEEINGDPSAETNGATEGETLGEFVASRPVEEVASFAGVALPENEVESALSDAAKEIAERATGHTIEMLPISSIPPTAFVASSSLTMLEAMAEQIKAAAEEYRVGASGKDEKVKHAIANLNEETDPVNFALAKEVADAKAEIERLEALVETQETKLYANVEERLTNEGNAIWSDETLEKKKQEIADLYDSYQKMHKAAQSFIDQHRSHKPDDNVGVIEQYHSKLPKPFSRTAKASTSGGTRATSGAPRNVSVSDARVSYDGGKNWHKVEGQLVKPDGPMLSNPQFLAAEIARVSSETGNDLKQRLYSEWYASAGFSEAPAPEEMPEVSEFDFAFKAKDGSDASARVKLTKKGATIEA